MSLRANWFVRISRALVITPKLRDLGLLLGLFQFGWFAKLNDSKRNCSRYFSEMAKSFISEKSQLLKPGRCNVLRPRFPSLYVSSLKPCPSGTLQAIVAERPSEPFFQNSCGVGLLVCGSPIASPRLFWPVPLRSLQWPP